MATFDRLAGLPLAVDGYRFERLQAEVAAGFERVCTVVHLSGEGEEGVGEDVGYDAIDHEIMLAAGPGLPLAGTWTLGDFCAHVESLDLFPEPPRREVSRLYRLWAFHSAALDLALRQGGRTLEQALGLTARPMTYVVSLRLGEPPSLEPLTRRLALDPTLRFKLDATSSWTPELFTALAATGAVDAIDFKAFYTDSSVGQGADPVLYRRAAEAFPDAWLEDADIVTPETAEVLAGEHDRLTWDVPIHSIADIESLAFAPRMVNIKPSRIGSLPRLMATYDHCAERGIGAYGGGQTELGPGRGQAQYLASIFHPDTPNDLAPIAYNEIDPPAGVPSSPLVPAFDEPGFRWDQVGIDR